MISQSPSGLISATVCPHPASASCQPTSDIAAALRPKLKRSPEAQTASAQRLHVSRSRFRHSKGNGCKLRAGTNFFHPVGRGIWEEAMLQQVAAVCWEGCGSTAMLAAAAGAPGAHGDGPGSSLNAALVGNCFPLHLEQHFPAFQATAWSHRWAGPAQHRVHGAERVPQHFIPRDTPRWGLPS